MNHTTRGFLTATAGFAIACSSDTGRDASPAETTAGETSLEAKVDPAQITTEMVALGNEIFHGRVANGLCYTCHGMDATGGPGGLGPSLTDAEWLHGDGSYGAIIETIRTGVAQPTNAPAPMPPMGGAALSDQQLRALAAYVYSLSHAEVPGASS